MSPSGEMGSSRFQSSQRQRFPENVLTLVFKAVPLTPGDEKSHRFPFKIASVCQAFRAVVLSTPQLWCDISSSIRTKPEALELRLQRSSSAGLKIHIGEFPVVVDVRGENARLEWLNSFLTSIMVHCQRWETFDVMLSSEKHQTVLEAVTKALSTSGVIFPRLLSATFPGLEKPGEVFQNLGRRARNLQSVSMEIKDDLTATIKFPKRIRKLAIKAICTGPKIKVHRLAEVLRSTHAEVLSLDFSSYCGELKCKTVKLEGKKKTVQFAVPGVKHLELSISAEYELDTLMEGLHFPALERLTLLICDPVDQDYGAVRGRDDDFYDYDSDGPYGDDEERFYAEPAEEAADAGLDLIKEFFKEKEFSKLNSLSLNMDLNAARLLSKPLPEKYFIDIFKSCPNLRDLDLQGTYYASSLLLPPLRSLTLNRIVVDYNCRWIQDYGQLLSKYEKMDSFEKLILNHCSMGDVSFSRTEKDWIDKLHDFQGKLAFLCKF